MKKILLILLALALAMSLAACVQTPDTTDTPDVTTEPSATDAPDTTEPADDVSEGGGYTVSLGDVTVNIGGDADALIAALGEPIDYMEAPSCIHEGYDKVYVFDGYSISTSPRADGTQYVSELSLTSDAAILDGTLMIGCSVADVEARFGTDYTEQFGIRSYDLGVATASVMLDGDVVVGITIAAS